MGGVAQEAIEACGRAILLTRVIDLAVERRRWVHALQGRPRHCEAAHFARPPFDLVTRVYSLLLHDPANPAG
jgi:hypothetical protein